MILYRTIVTFVLCSGWSVVFITDGIALLRTEIQPKAVITGTLQIAYHNVPRVLQTLALFAIILFWNPAKSHDRKGHRLSPARSKQARKIKNPMAETK